MSKLILYLALLALSCFHFGPPATAAPILDESSMLSSEMMPEEYPCCRAESTLDAHAEMPKAIESPKGMSKYLKLRTMKKKGGQDWTAVSRKGHNGLRVEPPEKGFST